MAKTKLSIRVLSLTLAVSSILTAGFLRASRVQADSTPSWYLCQGDYNTYIDRPHGGTTVAKAGCNVTCVAMAARIVGSDTKANPENYYREAVGKDLVIWDSKNQEYCGLSTSGVSTMCNAHGMTCEWTNDLNRVKNELYNGAVIIYNVGPGPNNFTGNGHYILLYNGELKNMPAGYAGVYDPNTSRQTRIGTRMSLDNINQDRKNKDNSSYKPYGIIRRKANAVIKAKAVAFVTSLYKNCLKRDPSNGEITYWADLLTTRAFSAARVVDFFFTCDEFRSKFKNISKEEIVKRLYACLFGREPDDGGKKFWTDCLKNGTSIHNVIVDMTGSDEFKKRMKNLSLVPGAV